MSIKIFNICLLVAWLLIGMEAVRKRVEHHEAGRDAG